MTTFKHMVVKYVTDRPGQVVYRQEVADELDIQPEQVAAAIRTTQRDSTIGDEITTVIRGHAWKYLPNGRPRVASTQPHVVDVSRPLTSLIREYLIDNAYVVVSVSDLADYTGRTIEQTRSGVNNMRNIKSHGDVMRYVETVVAGQMWRYAPPTVVDDVTETSVVASSVPDVSSVSRRRSDTSTTPVAPSPTSPTTDDVTTAPTDTRIFEEVGTTGNAVIIEDQDGVLYRAVRLTQGE